MKHVALKMAVAILGGLTAFLLNFLVSPQIGETPYYLGAIVYLSITARMGLPVGLVAACIASFSLPSGWIQALPLLEVLVLYWLVFIRKIHFIRSGLCFWLFFGAPFVALTHWELFHRNANAFAFALITFIAGGILNLILSKVISGIWTYNQRKRPTLRVRVYDLLVLFTAVPVFLFGVYAKRNAAESRLRQTQLELEAHSNIIENELNDFLSYNHRSIISMAASYHSAILLDPKKSNTFLENQHALYPAFLTMLIADRDGLVIAGYPSVTATGQPIALAGISVADRMYFLEAKNQKEPYLSGVFRGREFGTDPIVAMSAPFFDESGTFAGIVEGSLNLNRLKEFGKKHPNQGRAEIAIFDQNGTVTFSTFPSYFPILENFMLHPTVGELLTHPGLRRLYDKETTWKAFRLVQTSQTQESKWIILVQYDLLKELGWLNGQAVLFALILLFLMVLASRIAETFSKRLTEPLRNLIAKSQIINTGQPASLEPIPLSGSPREVTQLVDHFETMALRLEKTHSQLMLALEERDKLNADLKAHNLTLDRKVKERTAELEKAKIAAEKADVAKSTFLANMSHEIRTPMNALIGLTEVLADGELSPQQKEYLSLIQDSSQSLLEIINSILDYSKIEAGKMALEPRITALSPLIQSLSGLFRISAKEKGLDLMLEIDPDLPEAVLCDTIRLRQILSNLLSNAIKFTHEGSVTLRCFIEEPSNEKCTLVFQVADTGIGIPQKNLEDIFKAFEQSSNSSASKYGGTGLGLAISRKLAEMMGGTLTVTSELGFGSTFTFYGKFFCKSLPTNSETAAATASFIQSIDLEKVPKLLVVEDHRINQKVCEAILKKLGCEFTFADNGQEAIDHLGKETFDLVLMDCQMPVMDGYEATKHIRACGKPFSNIPIIALTANALSGDRDRCIEVGMDDFLSKPFNLHGLRTIIAKWFRGKP